jgi:threonyl-tRNA synthetase
MPISLILPDRSARELAPPLRGDAIAALFGGEIRESPLAIKMDGIVHDLATEIDEDGELEFVTSDSPEALRLIRDSAGHVLARAVQSLFPETKIAIGLPIENGFFYDFLRAAPFTPQDLDAIETRMRDIVAERTPFSSQVLSAAEARSLFLGMDACFKAQLLEELPDDARVRVYDQEGWRDICFGAHVPNTGDIGLAFRLIRVAGAYWKGDTQEPLLQRIYGTAWRNEEELQAFLGALESAHLRDHRRIGRELDLYHSDAEAPGRIYWHPDGWKSFLALEGYLRSRLDAAGYLEVRTPQGEPAGRDPADTEDPALADITCRNHVHLFNREPVSYRQLPVRMAEFRPCARDVPSDRLHGIVRVRRFTLDAGHIFCTLEQFPVEVERFVRLTMDVYTSLDAGPFLAKLVSTEEGARSDADDIFRAALVAAGIPYDETRGEAGTGPRIEFHFQDARGREWRCGMLKVDAEADPQLGASYMGTDGFRQGPVILHRTLLGGIERFLALLIERHSGRLPKWLMPVQLVVATVTDECQALAEELAAACVAAGIRTGVDLRRETIDFKVRHHWARNIPILFVVGPREAANGTVAIRYLGSDQIHSASRGEAVAAAAAAVAAPSRFDAQDPIAALRILR